ncbi:MAG: hypothetical protein R6U32_01725 [Candidatus Woesearchaeota archaeon]
MEQIYFYHMVSFITLSTIIILVYVFLAHYMKTIYRRLNQHMDDVDRHVNNIKGMVDKGKKGRHK